MSPGLSLHLDFFRVVAVLLVVVSHATLNPMGGGWLRFSLWTEGLEATLVLSGFVIVYAVETRERRLAVYGAARLARLWSVVLPALALTPIIDAIGFHFSSAPYENWGEYMGFDNPVLRLSLTALFQNQTWFLDVSPLSNIPLWTVGFMAWYYAIFAAFVFSPRGWRYWIAGVTTLLASPKILLLMPGWLFGAWLCHNRKALKVNRAWGAALFLGAAALYLGLRVIHVIPWLFSLQQQLFGTFVADHFIANAQEILWQNLIGALICVHLVGAISIAAWLGRLLRPAARPIRAAAALTFAIYALHFPLELMIAAALHERPDGPVKTTIVLIGALGVSAAIGAMLGPLQPRLRASLLTLFRSCDDSPAKAFE